MTLHYLSWLAVAAIALALVVAWQRRFLAVGAIVIANIFVHVLNAFGPKVALCGATVCGPDATFADVTSLRSVIKEDLGLHPDAVAAADPWSALQLVTHMFVHADFFHILGNLIILLAFALPFEERIGHRRLLGLYLGAGLVGAFAQMATDWGTATLMIGASGAVFGIIGAFAATYPNLVIAVPVPIGILIFIRMRVIIGAVVFAVVQLASVALSQGAGNIAYFAHLGGLGGGVVLAYTLFRRHAAETAAGKTVRLDLAAMEPFAVDDEGKRALDQMRANADEPEVFEAWLERFLLVARSPDTGAGLALRKGELVSSHGERFDVRQKA